ncbi:hypothetical protein PROFUN_16328 [Planoprotostelium fungivorum]|uniref:Uncharacterized protein n=1 Tax=Planoprotostelium fungivorum TaxID=1890364 RepID=A0A2P6MR29_9EUKA|nr:hypothetical protein PROFUN_16328 [Planoprotostelium fungivorum]
MLKMIDLKAQRPSVQFGRVMLPVNGSRWLAAVDEDEPTLGQGVLLPREMLEGSSSNGQWNTDPRSGIEVATIWSSVYLCAAEVSGNVSDFRPVCIKHALSTQKLTNVLQRMYKLMTGSKHSVGEKLASNARSGIGSR